MLKSISLEYDVQSGARLGKHQRTFQYQDVSTTRQDRSGQHKTTLMADTYLRLAVSAGRREPTEGQHPIIALICDHPSVFTRTTDTKR